jgi:hypothetical protein
MQTVTGSAPLFLKDLNFYRYKNELAVIGGGALNIRAAKAMKETSLDIYLPPYAAPSNKKKGALIHPLPYQPRIPASL